MGGNWFKKGIVKVEINVFNREQVINALWNNGIKIHNVRKIDVSTLIMEINYEDYQVVKEIVKRLQGKISIISSRGGIFILSSMKKSIGIVVGLVMFVFILCYLSTFIWRIEIETKMYLAPYEVRQQLKDIGIQSGIRKNSLNVYALEKKMENMNSDIMWVNARIEGSTLRIKIEEKINPPLKQNEEKIDNIIASMDGEIKRIFAISGTAVVKPGQTVKKGDILIIPQEGKEGFEQQVPAKGKVLANTFYEKLIEIQIAGKVEVRTGNIDEEIYIDIMGKKIYLKKPTKSFMSYDRIEETGKFIHKNIYYEKVNKDILDSKEDIINKTVQMLEEATIREVTKQSVLVDKIINIEEINEEKVLLKVLFVIEQDIAIG